MQFALNWSPQAADLLAAGRITFDLYKCPDWDDMIATASAQHPVYVHFPHVAGQGRDPDWARVDALAQRTNTFYINTHCAPANPDQAYEAVLRDVTLLCERFGADRVIVENVPHPDHYLHLPAVSVDAALIRRVVEATGCGLLLDLAHAALAAESCGWDVRDYISALPVERLREVHITGRGIDQQGRRTDHLPMTDADWELFEWALDQIRGGAWHRPQIIACEYGGIGPIFEWRSDASVIAEQIPRMAAMIQSINTEI